MNNYIKSAEADYFPAYDNHIEKSIKEIYETNERFHEYVKRYCRNSGDTIEKALRKKIIIEVGKEYEYGINKRGKS